MSKLIVLIVGPSGSGKSTLIQRTFNNEQYLRSTATRSMRKGEVNGKDYLFTDKNTFKNLINNNALVQYVKYDNNYYGVEKREIQNKLLHNDVVAIPVVYPAVVSFKKYAQENNIKTLTVFTDITKDNIIKHFQSRTDSEQQKKDRISRYNKEILVKKHFQNKYILNMNVNDHALTASQYLQKLIKEKFKSD